MRMDADGKCAAIGVFCLLGLTLAKGDEVVEGFEEPSYLLLLFQRRHGDRGARHCRTR